MPHRDFTLEPDDIERLANLSGPFDAHLRLVELRLGVAIANRGSVFRVDADDAETAARAESFLRRLYEDAASEPLDEHAVHLRAVQRHGDHPLGTGLVQQVGHKPGADRDAGGVLLVTARVGVVRHHHGQVAGGRAPGRVQHQQ